jgi:hypothetical protein
VSYVIGSVLSVGDVYSTSELLRAPSLAEMRAARSDH